MSKIIWTYCDRFAFFDTLSELIEEYSGQLKPGNTVYYGYEQYYKNKQEAYSTILDIDNILDTICDNIQDYFDADVYSNEQLDSIFDCSDGTARKELNTVLIKWAKKYLNLNMPYIVNKKNYTLKEEDFEFLNRKMSKKSNTKI